MSDLRLDLGDLDLVSADGGGDSYWFEVLADGFSPGSPEAVKTVIASLLRDGDKSQITRFGNRTIQFQVRVSAPDSAALNAGEKALALELGSPSTLTLQHPDGYSTTVWDVFNGTMDPVPDDLAWTRQPMRQTYAVTLECYPWSRPADKTSVTFTPTSPSVTTVDDGSTTTNWSSNGLPDTFASVTWLAEAAVRIKYATSGLNVRWSGTVPAADWIGIDVATAADTWLWPGYPPTLNGASPVAVKAQASGYTRFWYANPHTTTLNLIFTTGVDFTAADYPTVYVGGVYSAPTFPDSSGVFVAEIGGSVRTTGGITVSRASGISELFVYSDPQLAVSGFAPATPASWPQAWEGDYAFWVNITSLSGISAGDILELTVTGVTGATQVLRTRYDGTSIGNWAPLGLANLGGLRTGLVGTVTTALTRNGSVEAGATLRMFRRKDGETALTYYVGPASGTVTEVIVDIPSLEHEHGGVWANGVDALSRCRVWEYPDVTPPLAAVCVLMASSSSMSVGFEHYKRFHTYVGEEA